MCLVLLSWRPREKPAGPLFRMLENIPKNVWKAACFPSIDGATWSLFSAANLQQKYTRKCQIFDLVYFVMKNLFSTTEINQKETICFRFRANKKGKPPEKISLSPIKPTLHAFLQRYHAHSTVLAFVVLCRRVGNLVKSVLFVFSLFFWSLSGFSVFYDWPGWSELGFGPSRLPAAIAYTDQLS